MDVFGIDIASIVDLGTRVAHGAAMRVAETSPDAVFDYIVGIVVLTSDGGEGDG